MNRKIKFRGRRTDNGELVYGNGIYQDLPVTEKQKELGFVSRTYIIGTEFPLVAKLWHFVEPESVAQLVGYDKDGREVYEGDKVTSEVYEGEYVARLTGDLPPHPILQEVHNETHNPPTRA